MRSWIRVYDKEAGFVIAILFLLSLSFLTLRSIASFVFPYYYLYFGIAIVFFVIFSQIDFDIIRMFSTHLYIFSISFLLLTLIIGEANRGAVRWISLGPWTIQPAEIVRPFLILFFAEYLAKGELNLRRFGKASLLLLIPLFLILFQPSLGVTILTLIGFVGVMLSLNFDKKILLAGVLIIILFMPLSWFVLAPYQKLRIKALIYPENDPFGTSYNAIQSVISIGSGKFFGRGLGKGVQTQLAFLPERHTDFVFASISEESGFLGASFLILTTLFLLYRIVAILSNSRNPIARSFISGVFLTFFSQVLINIGMNMGIFPITGVPLPLISAGGSSLVATMVMLGMTLSARKN